MCVITGVSLMSIALSSLWGVDFSSSVIFCWFVVAVALFSSVIFFSLTFTFCDVTSGVNWFVVAVALFSSVIFFSLTITFSDVTSAVD